MGMKKARFSIMICVLIIATAFTLSETKPASAALWIDAGPDQTINEGNVVSFSTSTAPSLRILWSDDYEEFSYSGSIRQYLESKGHTVAYFPDNAYLDLNNHMSYDVLVVEHKCGSYTVKTA
ncbi:hypothetical protein KEJ18_03725 [Candidatus Bathyarchaeota archaeon]|nr:hypothetical protein [Candidatus Bathyarchaeota archaeon]